jgi:hypothetical protein
LKVKNPEFATFLIAINPFLIYYAVEIRLYTMIIFLSGALIFLMYEIYLFNNRTRVYRLLFVVLALTALHTQHYTGFLLVGIGVCIFVYKGWKIFKIYLIDMILPALSLAAVFPFLSALSFQLDIHRGEAILNIAGIVKFFNIRIVEYLFAFKSFPLYFSHNGVWLFLFFLSAIFLFSIKNRLKDFLRIIKFKEHSLLPIVIILLFFYTLIIIKIGQGALEIRHTAVIFLPLVYTTVSFIYLTTNKKYLIFWLLLFSFFYITASINKFLPMAKEGDSIRISRYIESHEKENELIFVPYNILSMPLDVHYQGKNSIINLPDFLSTEEGKKNLLKEIDRTSGYSWFDLPYPDPVWDQILKDVNLSKKFINENFIVLNKKYFEGMQLWYLKRKK